MKRFFSIVLALVILLCSGLHIFTAYHTTTYRMSSSHLALYTNSNGVSLLSYQGGDCHYKRLTPSEAYADYHIDHTINAAAVFDNTVVAISNDLNNNQLEVYHCNTRSGLIDSFAINDLQCYYEPGFYYNGKSIFLINKRHNCDIEQYDLSGSLIRRYTFNNSVVQIGCDFNGGLFAVSAKTLYRLNSDRFSAVSGIGVSAPVTCFSKDYFCDASGGVYRSTASSYHLLFHAQAPFGRATACLMNSIIYYPNGNEICGYRISSDEKVSSITLQQPVSALYTNQGNVFAVSDNGSLTVTKIHPDEFTDLTPKQDPKDRSGQAEQYHNTPNEENRTLKSSVYRIDFTDYHISRIPAGTTFAQLKSNIDHSGYTARLYRNEKEIKSGNCGTGMTVIFDSDSVSYSFELSVIGDLTGEGNVNTRDLSVMAKYLTDQADFNGVYYLSADLSDDGVSDVKDLSILHRSI